MKKLTNKVAIVTGAGQGIGQGIAQALANEGARVVVSSIKPEEVEQVVEEIRSKGGTAVGAICDVTKKEQIYGCVETAVEAFGTVDALFNNAQSFGTPEKPLPFQPPRPIEELLDEEWEHSLRSGLMASVWGMQAVFPHMKESGGKIVNTGSPCGIYGHAGAGPYSATKEAIRGLTRTAAREWGQYSINVNVIIPAIMTQTLQGGLGDHDADELANKNPTPKIVLPRWGEPYRDVGPLAVYLASSDSDYMTGQTLHIDGGIYLHA